MRERFGFCNQKFEWTKFRFCWHCLWYRNGDKWSTATSRYKCWYVLGIPNMCQKSKYFFCFSYPLYFQKCCWFELPNIPSLWKVNTFKKIIICLKKKEIKKDLSGLNSWGIHREYGSSIWCSPINVKSLPFRHWSQLFINSLIINLYNLIARFRISKGFNNHLGQMILTVLCMASKTNVLKKNTSQFDGIFCSC